MGSSPRLSTDEAAKQQNTYPIRQEASEEKQLKNFYLTHRFNNDHSSTEMMCIFPLVRRVNLFEQQH